MIFEGIFNFIDVSIFQTYLSTKFQGLKKRVFLNVLFLYNIAIQWQRLVTLV